MTSRHVVLASASPRRRALLEAACFEVDVRAPHLDEVWPGNSVVEDVMALARAKLASLGIVEHLAVAADTVVVVDQMRLGKPRNADEATTMLQHLSGRDHCVVTGFCVARDGQHREGAVETTIRFRRLAVAEIGKYVATREPYDKAGAYAIQGYAGAFIDRIEGSYTNVVGLPLTEVLQAMECLG